MSVFSNKFDSGQPQTANAVAKQVDEPEVRLPSDTAFRSTHALSGVIEASIPWSEVKTEPGLFNPGDPWALHSRAGLLSLDDWSGKRVLEVGIGTGVTAGVLLRENPEIAVFFGSDLNSAAVPIAQQNVALIAPHSYESFIGLPGSNDLLSGFIESSHSSASDSATKLDRIFGCIPQMLVPEDGFEPPVDALAHYIRPEDATGDTLIDVHGLALNARLLAQAASVLKENGSVVLTLSGRPPRAVVEYMFEQAGFSRPVFLHSAMVAQDPGTSIDQLARIERASGPSGTRFEFWGSDDVMQLEKTPASGQGSSELLYALHSDKRPMNACEARSVLAAGGKVFHELHVVTGQLLS